jgi:hypothetical protein
MTFWTAAPIVRAGFIATGLTLAAAPAMAQELTKYEQASMYSYLDHATVSARKTSFHGYKWDLSVYANKRLALGMSIANSQRHQSDLLFGPEVRFEKGRVGLRLHGRAGVILRGFNYFASSTGSSLDIYVGKGVGIRMQPEVIWSNNDWSRPDFRLSTGIAMRWGKAR